MLGRQLPCSQDTLTYSLAGQSACFAPRTAHQCLKEVCMHHCGQQLQQPGARRNALGAGRDQPDLPRHATATPRPSVRRALRRACEPAAARPARPSAGLLDFCPASAAAAAKIPRRAAGPETLPGTHPSLLLGGVNGAGPVPVGLAAAVFIRLTQQHHRGGRAAMKSLPTPPSSNHPLCMSGCMRAPPPPNWVPAPHPAAVRAAPHALGPLPHQAGGCASRSATAV